MLRIAVCDDTQVFLRHVEALILQWKKPEDGLQLEIFEDADSLLEAHFSNPFDIILLDILMPLFSGMEAAREIRQQDKKVKIVFVTSSAEFAVESYSVKADNYLLKPIEQEKLYSCLNELADGLREKPKTIVIKNLKALHRVQLDQIEYLEAQNKHVLFAFSDGTSIYSNEPLYTYEALLPQSEGFFKCNRSYIVNIHHIKTFTSKEIRMRSDCRISISRNCQKDFENAYFEVLFGKAGDK